MRIMKILNVTPDSFFESSRAMDIDSICTKIQSFIDAGADYIDIGAVSSRPGAQDVPQEEEWRRVQIALDALDQFAQHPRISIDTTRSSIVQRVYERIGDFTVNDISSGEDDPSMLPLVGKLGLEYIAMHKRGDARTMDSLARYADVMEELIRYFRAFDALALSHGIRNWILDPGLGFAKTPEQCWEILSNLEKLQIFARPILIGAAHKRFTGGDNARAEKMARENGADILRIH